MTTSLKSAATIIIKTRATTEEVVAVTRMADPSAGTIVSTIITVEVEAHAAINTRINLVMITAPAITTEAEDR